MINKHWCYHKIGTSEVIQNYFDSNFNDFTYVYRYGFELFKIPEEVVLSEPVLAKINDKFKIANSAVVKMDPNRCYKWHTDAHRGVSVNLLLTPEVNSFVLFGNSLEQSDDQFEILKFDYEPNTFYFFNNQNMHTIMNFDQPRYLFTLEFKEDQHSLSYDRILREFR